MSLKKPLNHYVKWGVLLGYLILIGLITWYKTSNNLTVNQMSHLLQQIVHDAGWLGPGVIMLFYFIQVFIPFPTAGMAVISGAVYGPLLGGVFVFIGLNSSGAFSFWFGRYFGRHIIQEHERGWLKKYDDKLRNRGFFTVLLMRLFLFPFDFVSLGCGMTQMSFRQYMLGTVLGVIPSSITFLTLGGSFKHPASWILFGFLLVVTIVLALLIRYSRWGREFMEHVPEPKSTFTKDA